MMKTTAVVAIALLAAGCAEARFKPMKEIKPIEGGAALLRYWVVVEKGDFRNLGVFFRSSPDEFLADQRRAVDDAFGKTGLQSAPEAGKADVLLKVQSNIYNLKYELWNDHGGEIDSGLIIGDDCFETGSSKDALQPAFKKCLAAELFEQLTVSRKLAAYADRAKIGNTVAEYRPVSPAVRKGLNSGTMAVLDFNSKLRGAERESIDVAYFTDLVRAAALRVAPALHVMTRENTLVLLQSSGKKLEDCEGECEVDTGRRLGADLIVTGQVLKVGSNFKLNLKMHETHDGRLLSGAVASGQNVDALDSDTQRAVETLIAPLR
jgi:hypothetical protein